MRASSQAASFFGAAALLAATAVPATVIDGYHWIGTTPCDAPVRAFLDIDSAARCDVIRWDLRLDPPADEQSQKLTVKIEYGLDGTRLRKATRRGTWNESSGTAERPSAAVWQLARGAHELALWRVDQTTLYLLDADRKPLVGNGGFAYTFALADAVAARTTGPIPELSYTLTPLSTGPDVYGVFEGRTPCAFAKKVGIEVAPGCIKLKWRLTLFQSLEVRLPSRYKLEGALFPEGAREGKVTRLAGTPFDPGAKVLALEAPPGKQTIYLMRGDENVLFLLDSMGRLGVGDGEFGYVLSRRPRM